MDWSWAWPMSPIDAVIDRQGASPLGTVGEQLDELRELEVARAELERQRTLLDERIREGYRTVGALLRKRAVELGEMPEPSGAFRSRAEPTKTQLILEALPGTRDEIARRTGIKPTVVATLLGRLQRDGGPVRKVDSQRVPGTPKGAVAVYDLVPERAAAHAGAAEALRKRDERDLHPADAGE